MNRKLSGVVLAAALAAVPRVASVARGADDAGAEPGSSDVAGLKQEAKALIAQLRETGDTESLSRRLAAVRDRVRPVEETAAENGAAARQVAEFVSDHAGDLLLDVLRSRIQLYLAGDELRTGTREAISAMMAKSGYSPGDFRIGSEFAMSDDLKPTVATVGGRAAPALEVPIRVKIWVDPNVGKQNAFFDAKVVVAVTKEGEELVPHVFASHSPVRVYADAPFPFNFFLKPGTLKSVVEDQADAALAQQLTKKLKDVLPAIVETAGKALREDATSQPEH